MDDSAPWAYAALEDKIVQQAIVMVLNQIYEDDFLGFSYGFRPGRSQHDALDALCVGVASHLLVPKAGGVVRRRGLRRLLGCSGGGLVRSGASGLPLTRALTVAWTQPAWSESAGLLISVPSSAMIVHAGSPA